VSEVSELEMGIKTLVVMGAIDIVIVVDET
jgi:hypothetical protein